jgi:hypothetical protein
VPLSIPTPTATSTPTAIPTPKDWAFTGIHIYSDQYEDGLLLYGVVGNNTGTVQELQSISGVFYNGQGQIIAKEEDIYAFWPGYALPPGGRMPFELTIDSVAEAATFDLTVEAEPSGGPVQDDFEFLALNQRQEDDAYCVTGKLRNPGPKLKSYLLIALVLYDTQEIVINYADYEEFGYDRLSGDETALFDICVYPPNQEVARYELLAWGQ